MVEQEAMRVLQDVTEWFGTKTSARSMQRSFEVDELVWIVPCGVCKYAEVPVCAYVEKAEEALAVLTDHVYPGDNYGQELVARGRAFVAECRATLTTPR